MNTQTELLKEALEYLQDNQHHIADNERHAYVMMYNKLIERIEKHLALEALADNERGLGIQMQPLVPWSQELESVWVEPEEQPAQQQEPVGVVICNSAGQISLMSTDGNAFDVSKFIGHSFYTSPPPRQPEPLTPEQTLDWLAQQHYEQCREERPVQHWIRKMKEMLP